MKLLLLIALAGGCAFTQERRPGESGDDAEDPGSEPPVAAVCDGGDPTLRLCLDFEGPSRDVIADLSANGIPAFADKVGTMDRANELAAVLSPVSSMHVPESTKLDITGNLALEMWIRPMGLPAGPGRYWMLDNDKQYALRLEDHKVLCLIKDKLVDSAPLADDAMWHHVGCTYDGHVMKVYVDGAVARCRAETTAIPTNGGAGLALGANLAGSNLLPAFSEQFVGGLDNVRVWARSDVDMCAAAGATGCATACSTESDPPS